MTRRTPEVAELQKLWRKLEARGSPPLDEYRVAETQVTIDTGTVLVGLDQRERRRVFVPVRGDVRVTPDDRSRGIRLRGHKLESPDGESRPYIDVLCGDAVFNPVFTVFVKVMLEELSAHDREPTHSCKKVLEQWRQFFETPRGSILTDTAAAGLFGELLHLRRIVGVDPAGVMAWVGPEGHRHDFHSAKASLEVKVTTRRKGRFFKISSVDQLAPVENTDLYFSGIKLESVPSGGSSLPELVESILDRGVDARTLVEKLGGVGYELPHQDEYRDRRFNLLEICVYRVDDIFPKILAGSFSAGALPPGVIELSYTIDLSGEAPGPMIAEDVGALDRELAGIANATT